MTETGRRGGCASVGELSIYHEVHGAGPALVLLHGGLQTTELSFGDVLPALAERHQVLAIELQGHGRTADSDRPLSLERLADDVADVMTHVGIERADLLGFSLGGLVAIEFGRRHPDRLDKLVVVSAPRGPDGFHDEITSPDTHTGPPVRMPTASDFQEMADAYRAVAPDPDHFDAFAAKVSAFVASLLGWSDDELRQINAPVLLMIGDLDFVRVDHAASMQETLPDAQLAVIPGTTHVGLLREADVVLPILRRFLDA